MKTPNCPHKRFGEWAEALFMARALQLGLSVSKPFGDTEPFDVIVGHQRLLYRVQVRATRSLQDGMYSVNCNRNARKPNSSSRQVCSPAGADFLAAYVCPAGEFTLDLAPEDLHSNDAPGQGVLGAALDHDILGRAARNQTLCPRPIAPTCPRSARAGPASACTQNGPRLRQGAWYIIPVPATGMAANLRLSPHRPSRGKYEAYREAWHLLKQEAASDVVPAAAAGKRAQRRCCLCIPGLRNRARL